MKAIEYHISYAARVRDLCYLGASQIEIAKLLGISVPVLAEWKDKYPEFAMAWRDGGQMANARVAGALFKRACGYNYNVEKETKDGTFTEEKHAPPDVGACIFWLTNRNADLWQSKVEHGGVVKHVAELDQNSEVEIARRVAFALSKALYAQPVNELPSIEHDNQERHTS